jgi:hypothetical protein
MTGGADQSRFKHETLILTAQEDFLMCSQPHKAGGSWTVEGAVTPQPTTPNPTPPPPVAGGQSASQSVSQSVSLSGSSGELWLRTNERKVEGIRAVLIQHLHQ